MARLVLRGSSLLGRCLHVSSRRRLFSTPATATAFPEAYTVPPPQPKWRSGQLSQTQVNEYFSEGFLQTPNFLTKEELEPVKDAVEELVDRLAEKLYAGGKIKDKCTSAGLFERLTLLDAQFPGGSVLMHKLGVLPKAFQSLWTNKRLLNVVEQFIGPDIAGHPVWNLRCKTPDNEEATVPWHQDNAYLDESCLNTLQVTAWIPLLDTNTTNGCMQVVRRGHRQGKLATHTCCAGGTWYVDLDIKEMEKTLNVNYQKDVVTCEVPLGGILWMNNAIPHRSLENWSNQVRWSLDLRWQDPNKPNGFHGLKDCIVMRKASDINYKPDWSKFASEDRQRMHVERLVKEGKLSQEALDDELNTEITGPWMDRWEITHHNRHTAASAHQPVSFLRDCIVMRKASDINYKPDWSKFAAEDRQRMHEERLVKEGKLSQEALDDELNTEITGPYMDRWEITHHNRHTAALARQPVSFSR
ncbi:uncharacterized protein LOC134179645 [Corticium candelabrum]|uniref:uncharacterized protein LOC134179645 n=1 Tax=Corticium candelabrum TaxID=121492 RepID=UPI002E25CDBB|nr:uncharacterized protein LOC134179645 [Corticium candelabrum]